MVVGISAHGGLVTHSWLPALIQLGLSFGNGLRFDDYSVVITVEPSVLAISDRTGQGVPQYPVHGFAYTSRPQNSHINIRQRA